LLIDEIDRADEASKLSARVALRLSGHRAELGTIKAQYIRGLSLRPTARASLATRCAGVVSTFTSSFRLEKEVARLHGKVPGFERPLALAIAKLHARAAQA